MLPADVRHRVDSIWDRIWASGVSNPLTAIEYFSTVLLLERLAESGRGNLRTEVSRYVDADDAAAVAKTMAAVQAGFGIGASPDVSAGSTWRDLVTLKSVITDVHALELGDRNHDILGDLFEYMLNHLSTAGHFGQFRTPRHLIRFLVEIVDPRPGEVVVDPACGTAGFLIAAHEHRGGEAEPYLGDEVDATMARVARTNILLHGMGGATVRLGDSLQVTDRDADVILANPPFAGAVVADRVAGFRSGTLKTELLFVELMMRRLREGGRAGVVVPLGVLTSGNTAATWIRRALVDDNRLRAVVELPGGVFRPYTGVKTGLLFWSNEPAADGILVVRVEHDGYSLDDRREPSGADDLRGAMALLAGGDSEVAHALVSRADVQRNGYNLSPSRYIEGPAADDLGLSETDLAGSVEAAQSAAANVTARLIDLEGMLR